MRTSGAGHGFTALCVALAFAMTPLEGCAAGALQYSESSAAPVPAAAAQGAQPSGAGDATVPAVVTGVWRGESWANCNEMNADPSRCGAVNDITFTLLQDDARVSGYYKCAFGNRDCRNMNETGRVADGRMGPGLLTMRVMLDDGSDCMFNGKPKGDAIEGGYMCMQGGGLVEDGLWRARRSY